jgi:hypothetical protein
MGRMTFKKRKFKTYTARDKFIEKNFPSGLIADKGNKFLIVKGKKETRVGELLVSRDKKNIRYRMFVKPIKHPKHNLF